MNYYYLKYFVSSDKSNTQINRISGDHDINDDKGVYAFSRMDFPDISEIKYLLLERDADLADIMNIVMLRSSGVLVNEKVKDIFITHNLPSHKYYFAFVKDYLGTISLYYWLQTSKERDMKSFIDFDLSCFIIKKDVVGEIRESVQINSKEELQRMENKLEFGQAIKISKLVLNKDFSQLNIDLFKVSRLSIDWIISERLKDALEQANVTGVSIKPINNLEVAVR